MTISRFHSDDVDWRPLEAILSVEECAGFMYMGWLDVAGRRIHHYEHVLTRRYLFVDDALETYRYVGDESFLKQERRAAVRHALEEPGREKRNRRKEP
ncbi:MAG: hypothetical protein ACRDKG_00765 [Actinomycetota bacterium]